jgi:hypothetical protein
MHSHAGAVGTRKKSSVRDHPLYSVYNLVYPIVCQINILVGVQALAWPTKLKFGLLFSEGLYNPLNSVQKLK